MDHPFFDATRFPWDRPDAQRFLQVLVDILSKPADIAFYYESSATNLDPLTPDAPRRMWQEALANLTTAGRLATLCDLLLKRTLGVPARQAIEAVGNARPSVESLVGEQGSDVVILDRVRLRTHIKQMAPSDSMLKAIVVRGGPDSGKSHGHHLFEMGAKDHPADVVYLSSSMVATLPEVIDELFGTVDALSEVPPPGDTTDPAYFGAVWLKLKTVVTRRERQLWIAVDDLGMAEDGSPLLHPDVRLFFNQLVPRLENPAYRRWFRLMLIHYPEIKLPTQWKRTLFIEDRTEQGDLGAEHVAEVLRTCLTRMGETVIESEVETLATYIVELSAKPVNEDDDRCRLERLHDLVRDALEDLGVGRL
jgi:hypothetical protein